MLPRREFSWRHDPQGTNNHEVQVDMDSERPSDSCVYDSDDSIDLRRYILVLFRRWRLIVTLTLVATAIAAGSAVLVPPPYEAVAGVAIVKTRSNVEFDPRFTTLSGDTTATGVTPASDARRSALLGLVQNGAIASKVAALMGSQLDEAEHNPALLMEKVKAEVLQKGDLILIRVRDQNPAKAAGIANAWAQEYERSVNSVYGGSPSDYSLAVQTELTRTRQAYDLAQTALERFLATNRLEALRRQIDDTQAIANALADAHIKGQVAAVSLESAARVKALADQYDTQLRVRMLLEDARAMRDQVRIGGDPAAASNSLALQLLKAQAFAFSAELPAQLQIQAGAAWQATTAVAQTADLDGLVEALEKLDITLTSAIAAQSQGLLSAQGGSAVTATATLTAPAENQTVALLQKQVRSLQSDAEQVKATWQTLTQTRELAWDTYSTLANKQAEVTVAAAISGSEVRFALPAVPPVGRSSSRTTPVLTATLVGLLLGVMAAYMVEFLQAEGQSPQAFAGNPSAPWNRLWRWMLS